MGKRQAIFTNKEDVIYFVAAKEAMSSMIPALLEMELDEDQDAPFRLDPVFLPKDKYEITIVNDTYVVIWEELLRKKNVLLFKTKQEVYDYVVSLGKEINNNQIIKLMLDPQDSLARLEDSLFSSVLDIYGFSCEYYIDAYKLIWYTEE